MTASRNDSARVPQWLAIGLVCMAGLLLEVAYTRIISYKLWYYYTYLVIGLSLLGIGTGGILVVVVGPLRRAATARVVAVSSLIGAVGIAVSYAVIARLDLDTVAIWDYGTRSSLWNIGMLGVMCLVLFAPFITLGVIISTMLGRSARTSAGCTSPTWWAPASGCLLAIPLITVTSPPQVAPAAFLRRGGDHHAAAPVVADDGRQRRGRGRARRRRGQRGPAAERPRRGHQARRQRLAVPTGAGLPGGRARVRTRRREPAARPRRHLRVGHLVAFDGDVSTLGRFDTDSRAIPFDVLGGALDKAHHRFAAGARRSWRRCNGAQNVEAVELNPVTVGLLEDEFADYTGHLPSGPSRPPPGRRPHLPGPERHRLRPHLVRGARQLRRQQRGLVRCVRALGELPLHQEHDPGDARAPERRRDHGRAVRRAVVRDLAQPHQPLRRHRAPPSRPSASRTPAPTCWCRRRPTTAPTSAPSS